MFQIKESRPPVNGTKLLLNGMRMCGFDETVMYELVTEAGKSPLLIEVTLSRNRDDAESRTSIGRIGGNRLAITVSNPSGTVTTTNQTRHQIVYLPEKNLQLTFAFCCIPISTGKFLFYHEFHEEPFRIVPETRI
jgi:hypothetical protein